jgi:hypothetical protein
MGNAAPNPTGSDVCVSVDMTGRQFDPMSVWTGTLPRYPRTGGIQHLVTDLLVASRRSLASLGETPASPVLR